MGGIFPEWYLDEIISCVECGKLHISHIHRLDQFMSYAILLNKRGFINVALDYSAIPSSGMTLKERIALYQLTGGNNE